MRASGWLSLVSLALAAAACGGSTDDSSKVDGGAGGAAGAGGGAGSGASGGTGGAGGAGGSAGSGGAPSPVGCPDAPPAPGTPCATPAGALCTFGDSVFAECHPTFTCSGGAWAPVGAQFGSCPSQSSCPASPPSSQSLCGDANVGETCGWASGQICDCSDCPPFGPACMPQPPAKWYCKQAPTNPACPTLIPNAGTACPSEGLSCNYPSGCGVGAQCTGGAWTWMPMPCPA